MNMLQIATGDEVLIGEGAFIKTTKNEIHTVTKVNAEGNIYSGDEKFKPQDIVAVSFDREDVEKASVPTNLLSSKEPTIEIKRSRKNKSAPYDTLQNLHKNLINSKYPMPIGTEQAANTAIQALYDFLSGRNTVNGDDTLEKAIAMAAYAKELVIKGKDNRTNVYE